MATDLSHLSGERVAFWSRGNRPTQRAFQISDADVLLHFKALYLLADRVIAAASFYFESPLTRNVAEEMGLLLRRSEILFFVNEEIEDFAEHGMRKAEKSPAGLTAYSDISHVRELGAQMDSRGPVLHRPDTDISGRIVELWIQDLSSSDAGSLRHIVNSLEASPNSSGRWAALFADIPTRRTSDFVWEYVAPILQYSHCPAAAMRATRRRLIQLYTEATAEALGATLDAPGYSTRAAPLTSVSDYDTELFLACLGCLGLLEKFKNCDGLELAELKTSIGWRVFRKFYSDLIRWAVLSRHDMYDVAPVLMNAEQIALHSNDGASTTRGEFVRALVAMLQVVTGKRRTREYRKLADRFFAVVDAFGSGAFTLLTESLSEIRSKAKYETVTHKDIGGSTVEGLRSFIVHGRDMVLLLELKDYIQNRLSWPEPVVLIQQPNQGQTIIEKFERHANALDIVFVLLSPDDERTQPDEPRARQNVIFELGYFVAQLGRLSPNLLDLEGG